MKKIATISNNPLEANNAIKVLSVKQYSKTYSKQRKSEVKSLNRANLTVSSTLNQKERKFAIMYPSASSGISVNPIYNLSIKEIRKQGLTYTNVTTITAKHLMQIVNEEYVFKQLGLRRIYNGDVIIDLKEEIIYKVTPNGFDKIAFNDFWPLVAVKAEA